MATVVVLLSGTCERSSTSVDATVISASVVSGVISDTEPTNVVLPAPNPPATTIFTEVMAAGAPCGWATLDPTESTKHPFEQLEVRTPLRIFPLVNAHQPVRAHVRDENPGHAERQPQYRGHLGHRPPVTAELEDGLAFRREHGQVARLVGRRGDERLDLKVVTRLGPSPRHRIWPHEATARSFLLGRLRIPPPGGGPPELTVLAGALPPRAAREARRHVLP